MDFWHKHGYVAAGIAAVASGFELVRLIVAHAPVTGLAMVTQLIFSVLFIGLLAVAAVGLAINKSFGWLFGVLGMLIAVGYGALLTASSHQWGVAYVLVAAGLFYTLARSLHGYERTFVAGT